MVMKRRSGHDVAVTTDDQHDGLLFDVTGKVALLSQ
jgi:hypothetical protein